MKKAGLQYPRTARRLPQPGLKLILWGFSLILAIGLGKSIISHFFRLDVVEEHRDVLSKEEIKNKELHDRLKEATSEAYVEKLAREKLGLVKEGETVIFLQKDPLNSEGMPSKTVIVPNWQQWWKLFF